MSLEQNKPQRAETREPPSPRPLPIRAAQLSPVAKNLVPMSSGSPGRSRGKILWGGVVRQRSLLQGRSSGWGAPQGTPAHGHSSPRPPASEQSLPDTQM